MSHLGVLHQVVDAGHTSIIVCEDDLDFSKDLSDRLPGFVRLFAQDSWDMIYGG